MQHLSGRILRPSLGKSFETEWTSSLGATHASPSVQPASDLEGKTPGISGRTSQEAFQFFNQECASLKTSRATLPAGCITFCATWEDWVTEQRGAYSQRLNAVRNTNASECLSWRTPNSQLIEAKPHGTKLFGRTPADPQVGLADQVANWPTAATRDWKGVPSTETGWHRPDNGKLRNDTLDKAVAIYGPAVPASSSTDGSRPGWLTPQAQDSKHSGTNPTENGERDLLVNQVNWATPIAGDWKGQVRGDGSQPGMLSGQVNWATPRAEMDSGAHNGIPDTLHSQMKAWATPQSRDGKGAEGRMIRDGKSTDLPSQTEVEQTGLWNRNNGKLNPRWVETLMGLPVGWTMPSCASPVTIERMNSDSSVTVLSQQQQNEPSEV